MALFEPEFGLIFWMLVVFLILLGILAKYAWPAIIKSIEKRADFIDKGVEYTREAENLKNQAEIDAKALLEDARRKQLEVLQDTQRLKQNMIAEARNSAETEAQKVLEAARLSAEQMKQEAEVQLKKRVGRLSLEIAGRVIRKDLTGDRAQEELVEKYLEEMN